MTTDTTLAPIRTHYIGGEPGWGREGGPEGLDPFLESKSVYNLV